MKLRGWLAILMLSVAAIACTAPGVTTDTSTDDETLPSDGASTDGGSEQSANDSGSGAVEAPPLSLPSIAVFGSGAEQGRGTISLVDPNDGSSTLLVEGASYLHNRDHAAQVVATEDIFYALTADLNEPGVVYRISSEGVSPLDFTASGEDDSFVQVVAVWPGAGGRPPRLAWDNVLNDDGITSSIKVGPLTGSGEILALVSREVEDNLYLTPLRWSLDGQRLYYSLEPTGYGASSITYFGFSSLSVYDLATDQSRELISPDAFEFQLCLDDLSTDEQFVVHHCGGGLNIQILKTGLISPLILPDVGETPGAVGDAKFNPSGTRIGFAMARSNNLNEQGWVAIADDLSGRTRLLLTADPGDYYRVSGWLDDTHLLVTRISTLDGSSVVLVGDVESGAFTQVAEGTVLAIMQPRASETINASSADTSPADSGSPADLPTSVPDDTSDNTASADQPEAVLDPPQPGDNLYDGDFGFAWPDLNIDNGSGTPVENGYILTADNFNIWIFTSQAKQSSFYAEITAEAQSCPGSQGTYGVIFHYEGSQNFRAAVITCTGRYRIFERDGSTENIILAEGVLPDEITPAEGAHRVGVLVENNQVTLYVDDYRLHTVSISSMVTGDIGPYVQTNTSPMSVLFTRLAIYQPR